MRRHAAIAAHLTIAACLVGLQVHYFLRPGASFSAHAPLSVWLVAVVALAAGVGALTWRGRLQTSSMCMIVLGGLAYDSLWWLLTGKVAIPVLRPHDIVFVGLVVAFFSLLTKYERLVEERREAQRLLVHEARISRQVEQLRRDAFASEATAPPE